MEKMAVSGDFANFRSNYDFYTDEVMQSRVQFMAEHLANWFRTLDTTSTVAPIVQRLQSGLDFQKWKQEQEAAARGMGGDLTWPKDPEQRLGMKLLLFRAAADADSADGIAWFGFQFIPASDSDINNAARRFVEQVFGPMARELRKYLEDRISGAPAADRIVPLNHNQPAYQEAMEALEKLEKAIVEANDYPDAEDKDQRVAEVSATRRLLQSARVRVGAVMGIIVSTVTYLAAHFVGTAIDTASGTVIEKLTALLGAIF
jgi:hypothetical protein